MKKIIAYIFLFLLYVSMFWLPFLLFDVEPFIGIHLSRLQGVAVMHGIIITILLVAIGAVWSTEQIIK